MVDPVQYYEVEPGVLLAGEYPYGHISAKGVLRLQSLVEQGVRTFIDLTKPEDRLLPYEKQLGKLEELAAEEVKRLAFPIPDMSVPEKSSLMREILDAIRSESAAGRMCYVHCWGGIGRTGTVVGCYLREQGLDAETALRKVQSLYAGNMPKSTRIPFSPQSADQYQFVRDWVAR